MLYLKVETFDVDVTPYRLFPLHHRPASVNTRLQYASRTESATADTQHLLIFDAQGVARQLDDRYIIAALSEDKKSCCMSCHSWRGLL